MEAMVPNPGQPTIGPGATGDVVRRLQRALRRTPDLGISVDPRRRRDPGARDAQTLFYAVAVPIGQGRHGSPNERSHDAGKGIDLDVPAPLFSLVHFELPVVAPTA